MVPPYIRMFPEPADVFADKIEEHSEVLFSLFSVDLNKINPEWKGQVHMLQYNEDPYNDVVADTFNDYCKDYMIGFDVIDGKYLFKTDFRYFDLTPGWKEWSEKTKSGYEKTKNTFKETGNLVNPHGNPVKPFVQIGGEPVWVQTDETPIDPDGNAMTFIARVYSGDYASDFCEKDIYLFYSDEHKLAVMIYQIT